MDPAVVALLAAGIPAAVAAIIFTVGEIIRLASDRRRNRLSVLGNVLDALSAIPRDLALPRIVRYFKAPELLVVDATMRVVTVIPRRHWVLWQWLGSRNQDLGLARGLDQVAIAADMTGIVTSYMIRPAHTIRYLKSRIEQDGMTDLDTGRLTYNWRTVVAVRRPR